MSEAPLFRPIPNPKNENECQEGESILGGGVDFMKAGDWLSGMDVMGAGNRVGRAPTPVGPQYNKGGVERLDSIFEDHSKSPGTNDAESMTGGINCPKNCVGQDWTNNFHPAPTYLNIGNDFEEFSATGMGHSFPDTSSVYQAGSHVETGIGFGTVNNNLQFDHTSIDQFAFMPYWGTFDNISDPILNLSLPDLALYVSSSISLSVTNNSQNPHLGPIISVTRLSY